MAYTEIDDAVSKLAVEYRKVLGSRDEPLDGDEVDTLSKIIRNKLDLHEGNVTDYEYENRMKRLKYIGKGMLKKVI